MEPVYLKKLIDRDNLYSRTYPHLLSWKRWLKRKGLSFCGRSICKKMVRSLKLTRRSARFLWNWTRRSSLTSLVFRPSTSRLATRPTCWTYSRSWVISGMFFGKRGQQMRKNMNVTANVVCICWCKRLEPSDLFKRVGLRLLWSLRSWQGTLMVWNPCWSIMPVPGFYIMQIEHLECCRVVCRNKQHCVIPNPLFEKLEYGMCMVQWELEDRNCDAWNIYFFHGDCIVGCVF